MKITIENTSRIVEMEVPGGRVHARLWQGESESGIPIICFVTRIAVPVAAPAAEHARFAAELLECAAPHPAVQAIDPRLII